MRVVFQLWTGDDGIFFTNEVFENLRVIQLALERSKTWGEFRAALPAEEFEALGLWHANDGDYVYQDGNALIGIQDEEFGAFCENLGGEVSEYVIRPESPFECDEVPGVSDGDYPPWLASTCTDQLPENFVEEYGRPVSSMVSGSWTQFPSSQLSRMKSELEAAGFEVLVHDSYGWDMVAE